MIVVFNVWIVKYYVCIVYVTIYLALGFNGNIFMFLIIVFKWFYDYVFQSWRNHMRQAVCFNILSLLIIYLHILSLCDYGYRFLLKLFEWYYLYMIFFTTKYYFLIKTIGFLWIKTCLLPNFWNGFLFFLS